MRLCNYVALVLAFIPLMLSGCRSAPLDSVSGDATAVSAERTQESVAGLTPTFPPDKIIVETVKYIDDQNPKHLLVSTFHLVGR
ncbi:MAG: hypothetical protein PVF83_12550 [Anaerolineales bacterium]|jgi:hypothetical protein